MVTSQCDNGSFTSATVLWSNKKLVLPGRIREGYWEKLTFAKEDLEYEKEVLTREDM